jgi:hypothetical protein
MEVAAYLKNGQSSNPTNFSNQSLSVFANEIAYQMVALYPSWVSKKENVTESFAHQFLWPLGKTIAEKNILAEEEKAETEALRSNLESEIRRLLLDASVACKAMLQRVPNRPSDKTLLNRLQTASQDFQTTASDEDLVEYAKELRDLAKRVSP